MRADAACVRPSNDPTDPVAFGPRSPRRLVLRIGRRGPRLKTHGVEAAHGIATGAATDGIAVARGIAASPRAMESPQPMVTPQSMGGLRGPQYTWAAVCLGSLWISKFARLGGASLEGG